MQMVRLFLASSAVVIAACSQMVPSSNELMPSMVGKDKSEVSRKGEAVANNPEAREIAAQDVAAHDRLLRDSYHECAASNDGSTWKMQDCIEEEFEYQDARLNAIYRELLSKLPGAQKTRIREGERQWLSEMEMSCSWDAENEGQAQRIAANICSLRKTAERVAELEKMLKDV